jgi:hypothetical protein
MLICEWHIDVPFGRQGEAVAILSAWNRAKFAHTEFRRARSHRLAAGHVGVSASHLVDAYAFESLADFEAALASLGHPKVQRFPREVAALVVPGSQHWRVYRVLEELDPRPSPDRAS